MSDRERRRRIAADGRRRALFVFGLGLLTWELLARTELVSAVFFPSPSAILASLGTDLANGALLPHLRATLLRALPALLIGGVPALLLGFAMGGSAKVRAVTEPFVAALHPIPKIALLPLFMVVAGIGETSKLLAIAAAAFFPLLVNTIAGVRQIPSIHFDVARNYGASRARVLTRVVVPGSLPMVMTGLRLAANVALLTTIGVEMISANTGLGARVWLSWQVLRTEQLYATLCVISVVGLTMGATLHWMEQRLMPWRDDTDHSH
jgi:ABC-type nitrate/sulfonate/bicarbonate transport system permease component